MGLDVGDVRIGVALSDPQGILASPFTIITRQGEKADIEIIKNIIREHQVGNIVVGLPLSLNGSIGKQAEKVQAFVRRLCSYVEVPVELRDERLTTVLSKHLRQAATVKKTKRKGRYDSMAAALILQGYLDEEQPY